MNQINQYININFNALHLRINFKCFAPTCVTRQNLWYLFELIGKEVVFMERYLPKKLFYYFVRKDVGVLNGREIEFFLSLFQIPFLSCAKKLLSLS
jgi:hypothetical protein